jgi:hypothetical protein
LRGASLAIGREHSDSYIRTRRVAPSDFPAVLRAKLAIDCCSVAFGPPMARRAAPRGWRDASGDRHRHGSWTEVGAAHPGARLEVGAGGDRSPGMAAAPWWRGCTHRNFWGKN